MMNSFVYLLGVVLLGLAATPIRGQSENDLFGFESSLFKDIPEIPQTTFEEKKEDPVIRNEVDKMEFENPLAKILAAQAAEREGEDAALNQDVDESLQQLVENEDERSLEEQVMSIISTESDSTHEVHVDEAVTAFMNNIGNNLPDSVTNEIKNIPLTEEDLNAIQGYERIIGDMIGQDMEKELDREIVYYNAPTSHSEAVEEEEKGMGKGVVDMGGNRMIEWGSRWNRRGGGGGGGGGNRAFQGRFRQQWQQQQQQQEEEEEERIPEPARNDGGRRRGFRRRNKNQQQQQEKPQRQQQRPQRQQRRQQQQDEDERPRRIAGTIGRARGGLRNGAGATRENTRKAAEFMAENAFKTAAGLGGVMVDVNGGVMDVVSHMDFDPINAAATKTAGYLVDMAKREVPGEILTGLLTTDEGNALETVRAVLLNSKNPEAMKPIVNQVGGNYVKVMKKVKSEMDGFLKLLFSKAAEDEEIIE